MISLQITILNILLMRQEKQLIMSEKFLLKFQENKKGILLNKYNRLNYGTEGDLSVKAEKD